MVEPLTTFASYFGKPGAGLDQVGAHALMRAVLDRVIPLEATSAPTASAADTFVAGMGSSQDLAHVFIACCRYLGAPARYVSGYLFSATDQQVANHAWADVWVEGEWLSVDIARGQLANGIHVRLATGLDVRDACPIAQVRQAGGATTSFRVLVQSMEQMQQ